MAEIVFDGFFILYIAWLVFFTRPWVAPVYLLVLFVIFGAWPYLVFGLYLGNCAARGDET